MKNNSRLFLLLILLIASFAVPAFAQDPTSGAASAPQPQTPKAYHLYCRGDAALGVYIALKRNKVPETLQVAFVKSKGRFTTGDSLIPGECAMRDEDFPQDAPSSITQYNPTDPQATQNSLKSSDNIWLFETVIRGGNTFTAGSARLYKHLVATTDVRVDKDKNIPPPPRKKATPKKIPSPDPF